jgi:hypothetical protein
MQYKIWSFREVCWQQLTFKETGHEFRIGGKWYGWQKWARTYFSIVGYCYSVIHKKGFRYVLFHYFDRIGSLLPLFHYSAIFQIDLFELGAPFFSGEAKLNKT